VKKRNQPTNQQKDMQTLQSTADNEYISDTATERRHPRISAQMAATVACK